MDIDVKTNMYNDTQPLLDVVHEQKRTQAPMRPREAGDSRADRHQSDVAWKRESWWSTITYWVDEFVWRRRYWNKNRMRGDR